MSEEVRVFTVDEAEALLDNIRPTVEEAQLQAQRIQNIDTQLKDMITVYGDDVQRPEHENHEEFRRFMARRKQHIEILQAAAEALYDEGVELKDPLIGLLDFYAEMGDELVYLCWHLGEERVAHWHTLEGGFTARRPIPGVGLLEP